MALDFGMALAKGLVAPQKELQSELRKLAGKQFKSEDWWNKQLDRQIKEGVTETKTKQQYLAKIGIRQPEWVDGSPQRRIGKPTAYRRSMYDKPQTRTVQHEVQRDLNVAEQKAIGTQAEESIRKMKRAATISKKGKRAVRGSGGLMGKATKRDVGLSSGLPELGSLGLGVTKAKLG